VSIRLIGFDCYLITMITIIIRVIIITIITIELIKYSIFISFIIRLTIKVNFHFIFTIIKFDL
jgi:hypothetical protein